MGGLAKLRSSLETVLSSPEVQTLVSGGLDLARSVLEHGTDLLSQRTAGKPA